MGVVFAASGIFSHANIDLFHRGLKAFFKLKSIFGELSPSIDTSLHIFDHSIKPILLYGCEIWGTSFPSSASIRKESEFKLEKAHINFECEKLSTKFYKYILSVQKKATNLAVSGDLGRTPYFIDIICTILKYLQRIDAMYDNSLLAQTLHTSKALHENCKQCWYTGLVFILDELNIDVSMSTGESKSKLIKRSMECWEKQLKINSVINLGKLRTCFCFKPNFKKENYHQKQGCKKMFYSV